jgi:predicted nucleic acid-binding protein
MTFWDASAVVPLLIDEPSTSSIKALAIKRPRILVWWASQVECAAAIALAERMGRLEQQAATLAFERLRQLAANWQEIDPSDAVRESAIRFLRVHQLRAADALQLAAAFVAAEDRPPTQEIITLDEHLATAARREGFAVVDI